MDSANGYWRLMWTRNLVDHGDELAGYGEASLSTRVSGYALLLLPVGDAQQEFSGLFDRSITLGVKVALP
jgi:hypothetical protein